MNAWNPATSRGIHCRSDRAAAAAAGMASVYNELQKIHTF
jgi:hypothetical protein